METKKIKIYIQKVQQQFSEIDNILEIICDILWQIEEFWLNNPKWFLLQRDFVDTLLEYYDQNISQKNSIQNIFKPIIECIHQKKQNKLIKKIIIKDIKYLSKLDEILDEMIQELIMDETKEPDKNTVLEIIRQKLNYKLKDTFILEFIESSDILTFIDNEKLEITKHKKTLKNLYNLISNHTPNQ